MLTKFQLFEAKQYDKIPKDFMKVYSMVTKQPFNNKIIILPSPEIYKYTNKSSAAMTRKILIGKNKIWIREMPDYQMMYELSHEVGHTLKPQLENKSLDAEETKAVLFQYCFVYQANKSNIDDLDLFNKFVKYRINHIREEGSVYVKYHEISEQISKNTNYNLANKRIA